MDQRPPPPPQQQQPGNHQWQHGKRPVRGGGGNGRGGGGGYGGGGGGGGREGQPPPFRRARFNPSNGGGPGGGRSGRGRGGYNNNYNGGGGRYNNYNRGGGRGRGSYNNSNNNNNTSNNDVIEEIGQANDNSLCIAVEGCCHGKLDEIYDRLQRYEQQSGGRKVDLLLICGDFQSLRNICDFHSLAVPMKYRDMGCFYKYYSCQKVAPILTIFIGGNHEASQSLQELIYGGYVAPNIYYMGAAGVVNYHNIRIGGISGIYKSHDYHLGRYERPPYTPSTIRSIYHVRSLDVHRLLYLASSSSSLSSSPSETASVTANSQEENDNKPNSSSRQRQRRLDIMLSHDWPQGIEQYGNIQELLRRKPFFRNEISSNTLGSPANYTLLQQLKPKFWFAAHLHVKFHATVRHDGHNGSSSAAATRQSQQPRNNNLQQDNNDSKATPATTAAATSSLSLVPSQVQRSEKVEKVPGDRGVDIILDYKCDDEDNKIAISSSTSEKPTSSSAVATTTDATCNVSVTQNSSCNHDNVQASVVRKEAAVEPVTSIIGEVQDEVTISEEEEQPSTMDPVSVKNDDNGGDKNVSNNITVAASETKAVQTTQFVAPSESSTTCLANDINNDLTAQMTRFLSLDKCLPRREYLSIVHVPLQQERQENAQLEYDAKWLAILRKTHHLTVTTRQRVQLPNTRDNKFHVTMDEMEWIHQRFPSLVIPQDNFTQTVPPYTGGPLPNRLPPPLGIMGNPQTDELLRRLELPHLVTVPYTPMSTPIITGNNDSHNMSTEALPSRNGNTLMQNDDDENEIDIDDEDNDNDNMDNDPVSAAGAVSGDDAKLNSNVMMASQDCDEDGNEINLDDEDDDKNNDSAVTVK